MAQKCPPGCGGCSCHISSPCSHCIYHGCECGEYGCTVEHEEEIDYDPTPENIKLTPEQDKLMCRMISHTQEPVPALKALTRWQFWFRQVWDRGYAAGLAAGKEEK